MAPRSPSHVRVGHLTIPMKTAEAWVTSYTAERSADAPRPYAYPAYDDFDGGPPDRLTDGDLLAPVLLNVTVKTRTFYGLRAIRHDLEDALTDPVLATPLEETQSEDLAALASAVRALYCVLDDSTRRPWDLGGIKLSKVLHRKRPTSIVLHDRHVRACYVSHNGPIVADKNRSWAEYMAQLTLAIREDLVTQRGAFEELSRFVAGRTPLSQVRILDILAWSSRGQEPQN